MARRKSEHEQNQEALVNLMECFHSIAGELEVSLIMQLHDQIDVREALDKENIKKMSIRYLLRWLIDMYADEVKDQNEIDRLFTHHYYHIAARNIGTEEFSQKFACCQDHPRR